MRVTQELTYDAPVEEVAQMLADPAFHEQVCVATGSLSHEVSVDPGADGGFVVRTVRTLPTDRVPDFARSFVGSTLKVRQVVSWAAATGDGSRTGTVEVQIENAPVKVTGTVTLRPGPPHEESGTHTAVEVFAGDLKAGVPIIGGKIEKSIEPAIVAGLKVQGRTARAWLAD